MIKEFIKDIKNIDSKIFKIMKYGLLFSLIVTFFSCIALITYIFSYHNPVLFDFGIAFFKIGLTISIEFIICAYAIDLILKLK